MRTLAKRAEVGGLVLVLGLAVACADEIGEQKAEAQLPRSLTLIDRDTHDGYDCMYIDYPCAIPDEVTVRRGRTVLESWAADYVGDALRSRPPRLVCYPTDELRERDHRYSVTATCDGRSESETLTMLSTHRVVELDEAWATEVWYGPNDQVVIELSAAEAGLTVNADFNAVDSGYTAGAEFVRDLGRGRYQVAYTLSGGNRQPSGDHDVVLTVTDAATGESESVAVPVRYLPNGPLRSFVAAGRYFPGPREVGPTDPGLSIQSVAKSGEPTWNEGSRDLATPTPDFGRTSPTNDSLYGQEFEIVFTHTDPEPRDSFGLDLVEVGRDGYVDVSIDLTDVTCGSSGCTYTTSVWVRAKQPSTETVDLEFWLNGPDGPAEGPGLGSQDLGSLYPPVPPHYRVSGTLLYNFKEDLPNFDTSIDTSPQDYPAKSVLRQDRPVQRAQLMLLDSCGLGWNVFTDDEGNFTHDFNSACGDQPVSMVLWSASEGWPASTVVFSYDGQSLDNPCANLPADPNKYTVYTKDLGSFVPDNGLIENGGQVVSFGKISSSDPIAAPLFIMRNVEATRGYLDDLSAAVRWQQMNAEYDANGSHTADANCNVGTHPRFMHYVPSFGWRTFAHAHEPGHYFNKQFLDDVVPNLSSYGRFHEAFSDVLAAAVMHAADLPGEPGYLNRGSLFESMDVNGFSDADMWWVQGDLNFYPDTGSAKAD